MRWLLCLALVSSAAACKRSPPPAAAPAPERTTPLTPDTPMNLAKPDEARVRLDLTAAREAVRLYQQEHDGKSPDALAPLGLHFSYPDDITYVPSTGLVRSKTYPMF